MSAPKNFSELNNKVYLRGQVMSAPKENPHKTVGGYIVTFTLAVKRDNLALAYNKDKLNYFACSINEILTCGQALAEARRHIKEGDYIEVYGILDCIPRYDYVVKSNNMHVRARTGYTSTINVIKWNKVENAKQERSEIDELAKKARKTFGTQYDVQFAEHAFDRDMDGMPIEDEISDI